MVCTEVLLPALSRCLSQVGCQKLNDSAFWDLSLSFLRLQATSSSCCSTSSSGFEVVDATVEDLPTVQAIYAHYVLHDVATYEEVPPDLAEITRRFHSVQARGVSLNTTAAAPKPRSLTAIFPPPQMPYLVCREQSTGRIVGYAYCSPLRLDCRPQVLAIAWSELNRTSRSPVGSAPATAIRWKTASTSTLSARAAAQDRCSWAS